MSVIVPILSTFNDKGIKSAVREFKTATTTIGKFGAVGKIFEGVGTSLTKNLTGPIVAVTGALGFMVKAGIEAEAQQHRLRQILTTTGGASHSQVDALLSQASALEKVGVASKDSIIQTQSQLATFDLQAQTIEALTPSILDYVLAEKGATASTEDFKAMTNGLAQAMQGNFASLTRTGFVLDDVTKKMISSGTESERAAAIVDVLNSTYKGFNASLLNTPEGQMIKLQQEFSNIREELGRALIPVFNDLVRIIRSDIVPLVQRGATLIKNWSASFSALDSDTRKNIIGFVAFAAVLGPMLIVIGKIIGAIVTFTKVFKVLSLAFAANPIGLILTALALLVVAFVTAYQTSEKFRNTVNRGLNSVITVAENLANGFITAYNEGILPVINKIIGGLKKVNSEIEFLGEVAEVEFKRVSTATRRWSSSTSEMSAYAKELAGITTTGLTPAVTQLSDAIGGPTGSGGASKKTEKLNNRLKEMREAAVKAAQAVVDNLNQALRAAQSELDEAERKFNDFKNAIAGTIMGILNFGKAADESSFLEGLMQQAADATLFADKIKQLILLGLSEQGIQQILNAGFEAGSAIADELIAGGETMVNQVNTLLESVKTIAEEVGDYGASQFYQVGVTQGQALVAGILSALQAAQAELQAAQLAAATGGTITSGSGPFPGGQLQQSLWAEAVASGNQAAIDYLNQATQGGTGAVSAAELAHLQQIGVGAGQTHPSQRRALGGLTLGGRPYLVGEHGPELFMPGQTGMMTPNHKMGGGIVLNVYAGVGTDGMQVGRQIVDAIKRFEKQSGPVFAKA
jgi:hypothetical protein